ncbi:MAG: prephenate dehydrogenase/arogenate dehydrogenase family protein [Bacteroidetes bacterium]|jgi:prephenate dehydrogenase|nr:prephenate dehydrogenase/arogenate dehydrogenase family protein [Bacteroidota bacterium]
MKILVIGAGRMGAWLVESLCMDHDVGVFDKNIRKLRYLFNSVKLVNYDEVAEFQPEMVINAVNLERTVPVFEEILPYLPADCILSDITSVKTPVQDWYLNSGRRFVSTHPMFGPTFANVKDLSSQSAIIINQSDEEGKSFFRKFYESLNLNIFEYTFKEHDETIAYSLAIPFASTIVFAACMKKQEAPGTTFNKHMDIAKGLLSEDNYLLSEILFSPFALEHIKNIYKKLGDLMTMIETNNAIQLHDFLNKLEENIKE